MIEQLSLPLSMSTEPTSYIGNLRDAEDIIL